MTVALIAQEFLTPTAKQRLELMLASDNDPLTGKDVASRATWADRYCDSDRNTTKVRYNATQNWHFVDIEIDAPDQDQACFGHPSVPAGKTASQGPADDCVVDKIDEFCEGAWRTMQPDRRATLRTVTNAFAASAASPAESPGASYRWRYVAAPRANSRSASASGWISGDGVRPDLGWRRRSSIASTSR